MSSNEQSLKFFHTEKNKCEKEAPRGKGYHAFEKVLLTKYDMLSAVQDITFLLMKCKDYSIKDGCRYCKPKCSEKTFCDELYEFTRKWV